MEALIGAGGHADDIARMGDYRRFAHHNLWDGIRPVIIGVNDPHLRADIATQLGVQDLAWQHPHSWIGASLVHAGTHVNYGVTAVRAVIGHHCTISPGVTICGDVEIGDRVLIGAGAIICDRVRIGDDVTIGAGTVVLPESHIPAGTIWVGNPARCIR